MQSAIEKLLHVVGTLKQPLNLVISHSNIYYAFLSRCLHRYDTNTIFFFDLSEMATRIQRAAISD